VLGGIDERKDSDFILLRGREEERWMEKGRENKR